MADGIVAVSNGAHLYEMQQFRRRGIAHGVTALGQRLGQLACALASPAQWRFRITPRRRLYQSFQLLCNSWVLFNDTLSPSSGAVYSLGDIRAAL